MNNVKHGRVWPAILFAAGMFLLAGLTVAGHHHWRRVITAEDIPIITGWFSVASTTLAYLSARASRAAANDSRRALLLHFRPEDLRAAFSVRNPKDPNASLPSPAPLWLTLTPQGQHPAEQYTVTWVKGDGVASTPQEVSISPGQEAQILLEGVAAEEDLSGPVPQTVAVLTRLTVECRDSEMKAKWNATKGWPDRGTLGSYRLVFEPDE